MSRTTEPQGKGSGSVSGRADRKRSSTAATFSIPQLITKKKVRSNITLKPPQEPDAKVNPTEQMPSFDQVRT